MTKADGVRARGARQRARLPALLLLLVLALLTGAVVTTILMLQAETSTTDSGQYLGSLSLGTSFAIVGWLIASRRSENPLGWIYLGIGLSQVGDAFAVLAATYGLLVAPGSVPGADLLSWVAIWAWTPGLVLLATFSLLLFPDGRLPSRRWRPVAWLAVVSGVLLAAPGAIVAWPLRGPVLLEPSGDVPGLAGTLAFLGFVLFVVAAIASVASVGLRFRRSTGQEHQQLKWFMAAAVPVIGFLIVSGANTTFPPVVWLFAAVFITPMLPAAIGIAVLRYRLFEIDRIVSRTIAYATVTAILAVVFLVGMLLIQSALASVTSDSNLAVAVSTLVVAALFQPLMRRIRRRVDRRFDRARYDGDRTIDEFVRRLRSDVELMTVLGDLVGTTHQTVAPSAAGVWIRASG